MYVIQVAYLKRYKLSPPREKSTKINPPKIRETKLRAFIRSMPKSYDALLLDVMTLSLSFWVRYNWHRIPLYEVDNNVLTYNLPPTANKNDDGLLIQPSEFNKIIDKLATFYCGKRVKSDENDDTNMIEYKFLDSQETTCPKSKNEVAQNIKHFMMNLPFNVFVRYVIRADANSTHFIYPLKKVPKVIMDIRPKAENAMTPLEKKISSYADIQVQTYLSRNNLRSKGWLSRNSKTPKFSPTLYYESPTSLATSQSKSPLRSKGHKLA